MHAVNVYDTPFLHTYVHTVSLTTCSCSFHGFYTSIDIHNGMQIEFIYIPCLFFCTLFQLQPIRALVTALAHLQYACMRSSLCIHAVGACLAGMGWVWLVMLVGIRWDCYGRGSHIANLKGTTGV